MDDDMLVARLGPETFDNIFGSKNDVS